MPNYPGSLDDDVSLFLAVNNARTRLTSTISTSDLTIPVVTTSGFPNQGFLTILTNPDDITEAEAIRYEGLTETTFSGVLRGAGGTFPFVHAVGNFVDLTVMAEHHNELKDAVIELEKIVGVSGSHNFVPKDAQGNAIVSGTLTAENLLDAGWLTVSGSAIICGPGFFKGDVLFTANTTVSGIATFGVPPSSTLAAPEYVSNETPGTLGNSASFTNLLQTSVLGSGKKYLVLYRGNIGWDPTSTNTGLIEIRSRFAGTTIGFGSATESLKVGHTVGGDMAGFNVITGDGANAFSIEGRNAAGGSNHIPQYGSLGIVALPLDDWGLVDTTDYWFVNGTSAAQNDTTGSWNDYTALNFTVPDAGEYLVFYTSEISAGIEGRIRFRMDGTQIMTEAEVGPQAHAPAGGAVIRTLTAGAHTLQMQQQSNTAFGASSASYQTSMFIMRVASFDQIIGIRSSTDQATNNSSFAELLNYTQTYTPNQEEQLLVLGTAGFFTTSDTQGTAYKITNTTDAVDYSVDAGMRIHNEASLSNDVLNRPTFMFGVTDSANTAREFQMQFRNPQAGGTVTTTDGSLVIWGLTLNTGVTVTPVTTIDGNCITTNKIVADIITTDEFNVTDITVTGTLDVSNGTTYLGDTFAYDITANNVTTSGNLTVSGNSDLCGDVDVKGNLTVSGTAKFGQEAAVAAFGSIIFASQDTEQTATSSSLVDANCETAPLLNGVEYLIIYNGYAGIDFTTQQVTLQAQFGGTKIGAGKAQKSNLGSFGNNHYNGVSCNGVYKVTGDGTSTVRFQFLGTGIGGPIYAGAMSITCIPLDQFTEGTDYFYVQNANNDTFDVTNAAIADLPATSLLSSTFNGMASGDWLFIWSDEGRQGNAVSRALATRFQVDSVTVGPSRYGHHNDNSGSGHFTFASAHIVNVPTGGNIPVDILVSSNVAAESDWRRGRIFAINTASFNQVLSTTDSTGLTVNSGAYQDFNGLNTTITPSQPNAPVIILTSATSYTKDSNSGVAAAIRNETDGVDYRDDSGRRNSVVGGLGAPGIDLDNLFMAHFEERTALTEYRAQLRSEGAGNVSIGRNDDDTGGEVSEMILWEFTPTTPFIPITQTLIDDDLIQTGTLISDTITSRLSLTVSGIPVNIGPATIPDPLNIGTLSASTSLTISGSPVSTGTLTDPLNIGTLNASESLTISGVPVSTGTGGAVGDFVLVAGDSMTGNLDMQGNNVYNAGVVAMQDGTPVLTTSGLLWFDTDATGHGDHGSASLPGGFTGALVYRTTDSGVADAAWENTYWEATSYDTGGWFSSSGDLSTFTVPSGVTHVKVGGYAAWLNNDVGSRRLQIFKNGSTVTTGPPVEGVIASSFAESVGDGSTVHFAESAVIPVSGGVDVFQMRTRQESGGSLTLQSRDTYFYIAAVDTRGIPGVNSVNLLQGDVNLIPGSGIAVNANSQTGDIEISLAQEIRELQIWSPDAPPASGTSFNSEWGDGPGLTGWTEWDVDAVLTVSTLPRAGALRLKHTSAGAAVSGLIKTAPTSNFTIFTKIFMMGNTSRDFKEFGIVFSDDLLNNPSTANFAVISLPFHEDGTDPDGYYLGFATQHFTDYNSFDRNLDFNAVHFPANEPIYLKAHVDVTTRIISTAVSRDGLIWGQEITSDFSGDLTNITEMGYWINNSNAASPLIITSDFFRVVENIDHSSPLHGDFLTVSGVPQAIVVATGTQGGGGGSGDGNITDINAQQGPSITITGTAGIGVTTVGNVITIDGTDVQGGGGATISGCYTHIQSSASDTWNVIHNLASVPVNYIVLDNSSVEVIPDTFTVNDADSVTITFVVPQAGTADIFPCISGTGGGGGSVTDPLVLASGVFGQSLTISGVPVSTGTGGGGAGTLQEAYDGGDGTISTTGGKPFELIGTGELTAVTGTFTEGLTVGGASTVINGSSITTASGVFTTVLTKNGIPVATVDDLFVPSGTSSVVSGTIIRPLGTTHNPLGLWVFDGNLNDSSGNGNTLTAEINSGDIVRIGPYLSGYSFAGNTILVAADDAAFKITGNVTWQAIIIYAADTVVAATKMIAGQDGPSGDGVDANNFLYRMAVSSTESVQYFAEAATGTNISFASAEKLNGRTRRLQHVAIVRENDDVTVYVDGVRYDTSSGLNPPVGGSATRFRIGGDIGSGAGSNFFTGIITSVKVNDFAFTDDQIRREYESTLATSVIPEEFTTVSGAFTQSLTVSGVPVDITGGGGGGSSLTVKEADGDPSVANVDTIVVTNGTLIDDGSGQVTISTGGGGGGSPGFKSALLSTTSGVTVNGFNQIMNWDEVKFDTDGDIGQSGLVDLNAQDRGFVIPSGSAEWWVATAQVRWESISDTNERVLNIFGVPYGMVRALTDNSTNEVSHQSVTSYPFQKVNGGNITMGLGEAAGGTVVAESATGATWFSIQQVAVSGSASGGSSFDPSANQTITGEWDFSNSLTVSGVPVATGTGGSASSIDETQVALLSQVFGS